MAISLTASGRTYIDAINRILRLNSIIRGGDDDITTFADTQHAAAISLAQIAVNDELDDLVSDKLIPYEKTSGTISLVNGTRTYDLASDFVRLYGERPFFYDSTNNVEIYEFIGGEDALRHDIYTYKTDSGYPNYWYWNNTTSKSVGFYQVPDSSVDGRSLTYDYEKSLSVTNATDTMPFHTTSEFNSFCGCAAVRLKYLMASQPVGMLDQDGSYVSARTRLINLINYKGPSTAYGFRYA